MEVITLVYDENIRYFGFFHILKKEGFDKIVFFPSTIQALENFSEIVGSRVLILEIVPDLIESCENGNKLMEAFKKNNESGKIILMLNVNRKSFSIDRHLANVEISLPVYEDCFIQTVMSVF